MNGHEVNSIGTRNPGVCWTAYDYRWQWLYIPSKWKKGLSVLPRVKEWNVWEVKGLPYLYITECAHVSEHHSSS